MLLNKTHRAVRLLVRDFLGYENNTTINTVSYYCKKFGISRGIVVSAYNIIEQENAIKFINRGHLGTVINIIDYNKLIKLAGISNISGVMPLPRSLLYESFASSMVNVFNKTDYNFTMAYVRGSKKRIESLLNNNYDFAIISKLSAEYYKEKYENIEILYDFGSHTYTKGHVLLASISELKDNLRVGIDYSSFDQMILTQEVFKNYKVSFISVSCLNIVQSIMDEKIDCALWSVDEANNFSGVAKLKFIELDIADLSSTAVLIASKDKSYLQHVLGNVFSVEQVLEYQKKVMLGEVIPEY